MVFGFIKNTVCINIAEFESEEKMKELKPHFIADNDDIVKVPEGYGIGDFYKNGQWEKAPIPKPLPWPEQLDDDVSGQRRWAYENWVYEMNDPEKPPILEFPKGSDMLYTVDGVLNHFEHYFVTDIPSDIETAELIKAARGMAKRRIRELIPRPPVENNEN